MDLELYNNNQRAVPWENRYEPIVSVRDFIIDANRDV